jgi:hypothetical protein
VIEVLDEFIVAGDRREGFTAFVWCRAFLPTERVMVREFRAESIDRLHAKLLAWLDARANVRVVSTWSSGPTLLPLKRGA